MSQEELSAEKKQIFKDEKYLTSHWINFSAKFIRTKFSISI